MADARQDGQCALSGLGRRGAPCSVNRTRSSSHTSMSRSGIFLNAARPLLSDTFRPYGAIVGISRQSNFLPDRCNLTVRFKAARDNQRQRFALQDWTPLYGDLVSEERFFTTSVFASCLMQVSTPPSHLGQSDTDACGRLSLPVT
ncbi:hypothetical protein AGR4B_pAt20388 [Agrobacterium tumefaciens str. CFBP 5621]|nr:hypothetical protein AGR4B_pAt20388 [Agrobacterium tumefaciens str. CFBP 5621]